MPSFETNRKNFEAAKEQGNIVPAVPVEIPKPVPVATYPASPNPHLRTTLPAISVQQPDLQRQWQTGATPQQRIFPASQTGNPVSIAQTISQITSRFSGSSILLETNNIPNNTQTVLNLIQGSGVTLSADSQGGVTVSSSSDGLTHGDAVWEHDSAYVELRDDFGAVFGNGYGANVTFAGVGELGWFFKNSGGFANQSGGSPPYIGQLSWDNGNAKDKFGSILLNSYQQTGTASITTDIVNTNSFALLENPGWKLTWVFKLDGAMTGVSGFDATNKSFYIGLSGSPVNNIANSIAARPDVFVGLRYDTSATPGALTLTSVANSTGASTAYTGTITGGANGAYIGLTFVVTGFVTGANNGTFVCTQSTATILTLSNAFGAAETHAATATASGLNDSAFTFEAVINPQYSTGARHNLQGQTFVTSVGPAIGVWHRLDMTCTAAGIVKMTLDGSATNTFTVTIPQTAVLMNGGQASRTTNSGRVDTGGSGTSGIRSYMPFTAGSVVTVFGVAAGLDGTWTAVWGDGETIRFIAPGANIGNFSVIPDGTITGYPSLTPVCVFGNDDTPSPTNEQTRVTVDFFSLVWNPNLGLGGTPDKTKARYW